MKRSITYILMIVMIGVAAATAQVSFSVSVPHRVKQGDKFPVTYRLKNAQGSGLKVRELPGCTLLYGPSVSTSQSTQIVNGQMSSSMTQDFTYYYRADKAGKCEIGEATIQADGKTLRSNTTSFTIVESTDPQGQQGGGGRQSRPSVEYDDVSTQSSDRAVSASDVFVRIILSKSSVYEQEALECEIKLYTKYGISTLIPTKQPAFDNFLIEELDISNQMNVEEVYNGQRYMTALMKKCILYPQKTGTLSINSGNYDLTVVQYDNVNMGLFQVQQPRERQIKISSNSASLTVKPLPEPRPEGFDGAVGRFTAESHLVGTSFRTGEPASLMLTVKGTGNIKYLTEPKIDFPTQFEVYTPSSNTNASVSGNNMTGTMSVDYTFVPQAVGDFMIPALPFSFFDPSTGKYETIELPAYTLKVAKGKETVGTATQTDIDAQVKDIRFIDSTSDETLRRSHTPVIRSAGYWIGLLSPALLLVIAVIAMRRRIRFNADINNVRLAKANKIARRRLKSAREAIAGNNSEKFFDEMLRAIWGYLSDKLTIPSSQLSRTNIAEVMTGKGYGEETINATIGLIDECELAKYAPAQSTEHLDEVYRRGCDVIDNIERSRTR
ncbi:MAG: BatD family protein [Clostridium sp.]|nr:BatD family protein [Clostridium sp.]